MRVIVCGSRNFPHVNVVEEELAKINMQKSITAVIHGCSGLLGWMVDRWARSYSIPVVHYPPNWEHHGKNGEQIRNAFMLEDSRPDLVVAFPGGPHTSDLVRRAINTGAAVLVIPGSRMPEATLVSWKHHGNILKRNTHSHLCHTEKRA